MVDKERPPYVRFECRSIEDTDASIEAGHYVGKDVDFVLITPIGSKDVVEREVQSWFEKLVVDIKNQRIPQEWLDLYKKTYSAWKADEDAPINGMPLNQFPLIQPTMMKTLQSLGVMSVEDLAGCNDETLVRIGMGSRDLRDKARNYLESASDHGAVAAKLSALEIQNESLVTQNTELRQELSSMRGILENLKAAQTDSTPKNSSESMKPL